MDITSNTVANSVTSLVVGAITSLVVDLAPLVEGQARCGGWGARALRPRLVLAVRCSSLAVLGAALSASSATA